MCGYRTCTCTQWEKLRHRLNLSSKQNSRSDRMKPPLWSTLFNEYPTECKCTPETQKSAEKMTPVTGVYFQPNVATTAERSIESLEMRATLVINLSRHPPHTQPRHRNADARDRWLHDVTSRHVMWRRKSDERRVAAFDGRLTPKLRVRVKRCCEA